MPRQYNVVDADGHRSSNRSICGPITSTRNIATALRAAL